MTSVTIVKKKKLPLISGEIQVVDRTENPPFQHLKELGVSETLVP